MYRWAWCLALDYDTGTDGGKAYFSDFEFAGLDSLVFPADFDGLDSPCEDLSFGLLFSVVFFSASAEFLYSALR